MRKMFCVILCVLALVGTTTMTSCTKDDWNWFADLIGELDDMVNDSTSNDEGVNDGEDEDNNDGDNDVDYSQLIRGTWKADNNSYRYDGMIGSVLNLGGEIITFYGQNLVHFDGDAEPCTYSLDGDYFEIMYDYYPCTGRIIELTSQKLVFEFLYRGKDTYHYSCDRIQ